MTDAPQLPREIYDQVACITIYEFIDTDGTRSQAHIAEEKGYGVGYYWRHFGPPYEKVPGFPRAMVPAKFTPRVWYFCPRSAMLADGGFHAPALDWLKAQWDKMSCEYEVVVGQMSCSEPNVQNLKRSAKDKS